MRRCLISEEVGNHVSPDLLAPDLDFNLIPLDQAAVYQSQPDGSHLALVALKSSQAAARALPVRNHRTAGHKSGRFPLMQDSCPGSGNALILQFNRLNETREIIYSAVIPINDSLKSLKLFLQGRFADKISF